MIGFKKFLTESLTDVDAGAYQDRFTWSPENVMFYQPPAGLGLAEALTPKSLADFATNHKNLSPEQERAVWDYKGIKYKRINPPLRESQGKVHHELVPDLDKATSHRTIESHKVYRGGVPGSKKDFKVGSHFVDHGYVSTSFKHKTAHFFSDLNKSSFRNDRTVIHVIHVPKGTKAHYFSSPDRADASEHELVLHRGTKFKVTHHSQKNGIHYIHSRVVGQR